MNTTSNGAQDTMRLDKWLWCARFFKTRALANAAIRTGKVLSNQERCKPSRLIRIGDILKIRQGPVSTEIRILAMTSRRLGAALAAALYAETEAGKSERELQLLQLRANMPVARPQGRPTKKDRRAVIRFTRAGGD